MKTNQKSGGHGHEVSTSRKLVILGAIGPLLALILLSIDIAISPWFTWSKSALSDLGVHQYSILFNGGIFIEGLLNIGFIYGLYRYFRLGRVNAVILLIAGISLSFVGIFNEHFTGIHITLALIYFILFPLGIIGFSMSSSRKGLGERGMGVILAIVGLAFIVVGILEDFSLVKTPLGLGFYELVEAVCLIVWSVEVSLRRVIRAGDLISLKQ